MKPSYCDPDDVEESDVDMSSAYNKRPKAVWTMDHAGLDNIVSLELKHPPDNDGDGEDDNSQNGSSRGRG